MEEVNFKKRKKMSRSLACSVKCVCKWIKTNFFAKSYAVKREKSHRDIALKRDLVSLLYCENETNNFDSHIRVHRLLMSIK